MTKEKAKALASITWFTLMTLGSGTAMLLALYRAFLAQAYSGLNQLPF